MRLNKALARLIVNCKVNISPSEQAAALKDTIERVVQLRAEPPETIPGKRLHEDAGQGGENESVAPNVNEAVSTKRQKLSDQYAALIEETKMINARLKEIDRKLERLAKLKHKLK
jgi:hypothetical protein